MKKLLVLSIVVWLLGCELREPALTQSEIGVNITKGQDESVLINSPGHLITSFEVKVLAISEWRCPSDVVCVHAGDAEVNFEINEMSFALTLGEFKEFTIDGQQLKITLIDVLPFPTTVNHNEKKRAVFVIEVN